VLGPVDGDPAVGHVPVVVRERRCRGDRAEHDVELGEQVPPLLPQHLAAAVAE
jgi:hypothetical protein